MRTTSIFLLMALVIGFSVPGLAQEKKARGYLGINIDGTKISFITPGSPAEKSGLKVGDVILQVGDNKVDSRQALIKNIAGRFAGDVLAFKIKRGEETLDLKVTLGKRQMSRFMPKRINKPPHYTRKGVPLTKAQALSAGLAWMASQQEANGSFPAEKTYSRKEFYVAISSLAGMALMTDPAHEEAFEKALAFILSCAHPEESGYFYEGTQPSFKGMWEHGFAVQFLAEAYMYKKEKGQDVSKIEQPLNDGLQLILDAQNIEGGWGYRATPDPHAEVGPAAAMLDAMLLCQKAGLTVPQSAVDKALTSQAALMLKPGPATVQGEWRSFSYEANAMVLGSLMGWQAKPEVQMYVDAISKIDPATYFENYTEQTIMEGAYWATGNHTLGLYYSALAYRRMGEVKAASFAKWHGEVCAHLAKVQNEQGAFKGWFGDVYGTAFACLTLAADSDKLAHFALASQQGEKAKEQKPEQTVQVVLDPTLEISAQYILNPSVDREHGWQGKAATVSQVGLKTGGKTWTGKDLALWIPTEGLYEGQSWNISEAQIASFFSVFHEAVIGKGEASVKSLTPTQAEIDLKFMVKFGEPEANHIQTTCLRGTLVIDMANKRVSSINLKTVRGCIQVKQRTRSYVSLNDLEFVVKAEAKETANAPQ